MTYHSEAFMNVQESQMIAKIQHFYDILMMIQDEKETMLLNGHPQEAKIQCKQQLEICKELSKVYHNIFNDILYDDDEKYA